MRATSAIASYISPPLLVQRAVFRLLTARDMAIASRNGPFELSSLYTGTTGVSMVCFCVSTRAASADKLGLTMLIMLSYFDVWA